MVLEGDVETTPETLPIIIPELQNRSVISVVSGGRRLGTLTSSGKLLAWEGIIEELWDLETPGSFLLDLREGTQKRNSELQPEPELTTNTHQTSEFPQK